MLYSGGCTLTRKCLTRMKSRDKSQGILKGKDHCTIDHLFDWFGISCMTTDNFSFHLQNRLIQTSQTGGQQCIDISHFSIPCSSKHSSLCVRIDRTVTKKFYTIDLKVLESVARFRLAGRIPTIVWRHTGNGAVLAR